MVRDGDGRHLELSRAIHQATDFTRPVEQAVVSVEMKMDEVFGWHPANILTETVWSWRTYVQESEVRNNTFSRQPSTISKRAPGLYLNADSGRFPPHSTR